jgi:EmrB/QacA subfamily drug resistance transporter
MTVGEAEPANDELEPTSDVRVTEPTQRSGRVTPRVAVTVAYVSAVFMSAMDVHIVNVSLPSLSRDFHSPLASVQWVAISYALSLAVVMPTSGWLADRRGTKQVFIFALATFTVASALCGLASTLPELVIFRVLQGFGGGLLVPVGTTMLFRIYPPAERARITRLLLLPIVLSPAIAPVLGGLLIEKLSWRWVFYINVPIGVAAVIFNVIFLTEHREDAHRSFDLVGFAMSAVGFALVLYAISEGSLTTWTSTRVLTTGVIGILALVTFIAVELRRSNPMLQLRLFQDRIFRATNVVGIFNFGAFFGILFLAPVFLQEVRGQSALSSGLATFPEAIGVMVGSQSISRLYGRVGPRLMMSLGGLAFAVPLLLFALIGPHTNLWVVRTLMFFVGFTNTAVLNSSQAAMFTTISPKDTGHASAISNSQRQVSLAAGIAVLSTVVTTVHGNRFSAFHAAFITAAGFAVLGALFSWTLVRDKDAAATMVPHRRRTVKA